MSEDLYWTLIDIANGLLSGAMLGGYYAIISLGLALVFGVMRLVNLAHGDWLIVAAYIAAVVVQFLGFPPFVSLIVVVPTMFAIGYALQRYLLNRVSVQAMEEKGMSSNFGLMSPILVTFGMSIVIAHALLGIFASDATVIKNAAELLGDPAFTGPQHLDTPPDLFLHCRRNPGERSPLPASHPRGASDPRGIRRSLKSPRSWGCARTAFTRWRARSPSRSRVLPASRSACRAPFSRSTGRSSC